LEQLIDFHAPEVQAVLDTLLKDRSTGKNIIWATDPPEELQTVMYEPVTDKSQITTQQLGLTHYEVVLPRMMKQTDTQQQRTRKKGEVFSPAWVCNKMNNALDADWFRGLGAGESAGQFTVEMQFMADLVLECESCHGKRFKSDTLEVKFQDKNIYDILEMTVNQAIEFFTEHGQKKIVKKLTPLQDVGLGYIKLGQSSSTLSGGENQRVKLAYFLSVEKTQPTIFVFDEPTTGLHFHDIKKLLEAFDALISRGHTIVIIEHNLDVIKCADYVIDLGPEGGKMGGNLVVAGTPEEIAQCAASYTGQFLKEKYFHPLA